MARAAAEKAYETELKDARLVRITDANAAADLEAAMRGGGLFAEKRVAVFENVLENPEMRETLLKNLERLQGSAEAFFIVETKIDAATKRTLQKYALSFEEFEPAKKASEATSIFALANALRAGDRKALWTGYQRELIGGSAPEAIHGVLFWASKDLILKARSAQEERRAKRLVEILAELPHLSRRKGEELEYALERFALSKAW